MVIMGICENENKNMISIIELIILEVKFSKKMYLLRMKYTGTLYIFFFKKKKIINKMKLQKLKNVAYFQI